MAGMPAKSRDLPWGGRASGCDQAHAPATARAGEHVEVEGAPHQIGPRPVAGFAGSIATELGDLRRGGSPRRRCFPQNSKFALLEPEKVR